MQLHFKGPLIAVEDVSASKEFYETLLNQKIKFDLGACQQFESGLTLQAKDTLPQLFGFKDYEIIRRSNAAILYFETDDFDGFVQKLEKNYDYLEYVHEVVEFEWGQRSVCFYDLDEHPVDVSETMECVCKRLLSQGMSTKEVAKKTQHPIEFVSSCLDAMQKK